MFLKSIKADSLNPGHKDPWIICFTAEGNSQFMKEIQIKRVPEQTALDMIISYVAFIFDINFKYSCEVIKKESYIDGMLDAFNYKLDSTKVQIEEIREFAKKYLNRRLGK